MDKELTKELRVIENKEFVSEMEQNKSMATKKGHTNPLYKQLSEFHELQKQKKFGLKDLLR